MIRKNELDPETLTYIDLAKSSRTYDEYVFKCEISQRPPKSEYEYDVNHWGHIVIPIIDTDEFITEEVVD